MSGGSHVITWEGEDEKGPEGTEIELEEAGDGAGSKARKVEEEMRGSTRLSTEGSESMATRARPARE
jgi:hypothetical protein